MIFNKAKYLQLLEKRKIEAALEYRASFTPEYLYKFFGLNEIKDEEVERQLVQSNEQKFSTLENNQLWFALPEYQNDPYEFSGMYLDKARLLSWGFDLNAIESVEQMIRNIPICCFVANSSSNLPMWVHYANNHRGYCVKYKVNNKMSVRNIIYEPKRIPIATIFAEFLTAAKKFDDGVGPMDDVRFYSMILQEMLFIKHDSWSSENEYRIVFPSEKSIEKGMYVSVTDVGLEVSEIICGYKCARNHIERLSRIADSLSVPCRKCSLSETDFTVYDEV